jgi:hypothetical protein
VTKSSNLPGRWALPDNSRLTSNQYSFRLPVHVAAKIAALCKMYPERSRTEIVGDLLSEALQEVEHSFPPVKGKEFMENPDTGEMMYEDAGRSARFRDLASRYYREIEMEMGNENPKPLYSGAFLITESDLKGK